MQGGSSQFPPQILACRIEFLLWSKPYDHLTVVSPASDLGLSRPKKSTHIEDRTNLTPSGSRRPPQVQHPNGHHRPRRDLLNWRVRQRSR